MGKEKGKDLGNLTARKDKAEAPIKTNGRSGAYIILQPGVRLTPQQLVNWCSKNLDWNHRLRGGLVVAERLPNDLETLDKAAVGIEVLPSPSLPIPVTPI